MNKKIIINYGYYILISILVIVIYFVSLPIISNYNLNNIPRGDPYTYTVGWINWINELNDHSYIRNVIKSLSCNWYLLQYIIIAIINPIISVNPTAIAAMNFVSYLTAIFIIFLVFSRIYKKEVGLVISIFYAILPWHHGLDKATSLFSLQLDSVYTNIMTSAILLLSISNLKSIKIHYFNAMLGFMLGLTVWSRSNAIVPLAIFLTLHCIQNAGLKITFYKKLLKRRYTAAKIFFFMATYYYFQFYKVVIGYYSTMVTYIHFDTKLFLTHLITIPSIFIFGSDANRDILIISSFVLYSLMIFEVISARSELKKSVDVGINQVIIFSFNAFFIIFFIYVYKFHSLNVYQGYVPILSPLFVFWAFVISKKIQAVNFLNYLVISCMCLSIPLVYMYNKTTNTPTTATFSANWNTFTPNSLSRFSNEIEKNFPNKNIAFLYYGPGFNTALVNYYRVLGGKKSINGKDQTKIFYENQYWHFLWSPVNPETQLQTREGLQLAFENANYIIMPDSISCYQNADIYSLYKNGEMVFSNLAGAINNFSIKSSFFDYGCKVNIWERRMPRKADL